MAVITHVPLLSVALSSRIAGQVLPDCREKWVMCLLCCVGLFQFMNGNVMGVLLEKLKFFFVYVWVRLSGVLVVYGL